MENEKQIDTNITLKENIEKDKTKDIEHLRAKYLDKGDECIKMYGDLFGEKRKSFFNFSFL
jgi:hypothetical protein